MSWGGAGSGPTAGNTSVDADAKPDGSPCTVGNGGLATGMLSPPAVDRPPRVGAPPGVATLLGVGIPPRVVALLGVTALVGVTAPPRVAALAGLVAAASVRGGSTGSPA